MADLPTGTVTFLFTDLEGSTRLLAHPAAYREAMRRHHALLCEAVEGHGGAAFETAGTPSTPPSPAPPAPSPPPWTNRTVRASGSGRTSPSGRNTCPSNTARTVAGISESPPG
jgi:class 3 adenylate cyclase